MVDSNAAFAGAILTVFLAAVRVSISVPNTAAVVELDSGLRVGSPTTWGSKVVILQGCGGWDRWRVEDG